jgi:hypothetical protein
MSDLRVVALIVTLGAAMIICAVLGVRHRVGYVLLTLLSVIWLLVDQDFEGDILLTVSNRHGLTTSDLFGLAGLAVAALLWLRQRRGADKS